MNDDLDITTFDSVHRVAVDPYTWAVSPTPGTITWNSTNTITGYWDTTTNIPNNGTFDIQWSTSPATIQFGAITAAPFFIPPGTPFGGNIGHEKEIIEAPEPVPQQIPLEVPEPVRQPVPANARRGR